MCDAMMVANIEIRGVDSQSCHFIWGLMLGYYDVEDTWPQFNRTKQACAPHARARSLTLLYCFQKGIELSISFIVGIHTYAGEAAHMGGGWAAVLPDRRRRTLGKQPSHHINIASLLIY